MMIRTVYIYIMVGVALVFYQRDIAFGRETVLTASDTDIGGKRTQFVVVENLAQQDGLSIQMTVELLVFIHGECENDITDVRTDVGIRTDGAGIVLADISIQMDIAKTRQFIGQPVKGLFALADECLRDMEAGRRECPCIIAHKTFSLKLKRLVAGGDSQVGTLEVAANALQ